MRKFKLGACVAALAVIGTAATVLAAPVPTASMKMCSSADRSYAQGYANGNCTSNGGSGGTVTGCNDNGDGTITFSWTCY